MSSRKVEVIQFDLSLGSVAVALGLLEDIWQKPDARTQLSAGSAQARAGFGVCSSVINAVAAVLAIVEHPWQQRGTDTKVLAGNAQTCAGSGVVGWAAIGGAARQSNAGKHQCNAEGAKFA